MSKLNSPWPGLAIISGEDGKIYVEDDFSAGIGIRASCHGYRDYAGNLDKGTEGTSPRTQ